MLMGFYVAPGDAQRDGAPEFHLAARFARHSARSRGPPLDPSGFGGVSMVPASLPRRYGFAHASAFHLA